MRTWIELAIFPVGLVVGFIALGTNSFAGVVIALVWIFVVLPHGAKFLIGAPRAVLARPSMTRANEPY